MTTAPAVKKPVALIAGPTASGKSDLAVALALRLQEQGRRAVVVNADSAQVYADLQVLSARPTGAEMRGIEHRLFGTWDGAIPCSAADWADAAGREITALHAQNAVPILCGGTGLYFKVLIEGIAPIPPIDPAIREAVRTLASPEAYRALQSEDPQRAVALNPRDRQRIARALEVVRSTGRTLGEWHDERASGIGDTIALHPAILLPDRKLLYARCDRRFAAMLERGAIEEVRALLERGLDPALPVMRAIGVPEISSYLRGELSRDAMLERGQIATQQYAKRQYTWFRRQPPPDWARFDTENVVVEDVFVSLFQDNC